jgi:hypothetical protein
MKFFINLYLLLTAMLLSVQFSISQSTIDNSKFVNQSIPDQMAPGQGYTLIVTYENNGTTSWVPGEYRLRVLSDNENVWSISDMDLTQTVEPGNTASFNVAVKSPSSDGVYPFYTQLLRNGNIFGEPSKRIDVSVSRQVSTLNNSAFVEQTIPSQMETGSVYKVSISMTNTGMTSWSPSMYRLVLLDASGTAYSGGNWSKYSSELTETIQPGASKVFTFELLPLVPGTYTLQWRMATSEGGLFGDASNPAVVTVKAPEVKKNEGKSGKEFK